MRKLLNTLYVTTQGAYLHKDGDTVVVESNGLKILQLPIHTIGSIVCFGNVLCSPFLLGFCASRDISISFLSEHGNFLAALRGPVQGNVLLRREQYRFADSASHTLSIAGNCVLGKISNCSVVLKRMLRDHSEKVNTIRINEALQDIKNLMACSHHAETLDELRGYEGLAAAKYFGVFDEMIIGQEADFTFTGRNRRPPTDNVNALLSYIYTILSHDMRSALESVGLDPSVGFLHSDRPGRYGLALDLMEEFRPVIADRLVLSLINRGQVKGSDFSQSITHSVTMTDSARKTVLSAYQLRKNEKIFHPFLKEEVPIGLLFSVQANLLARYIRGDIDGYPPFFWR